MRVLLTLEVHEFTPPMLLAQCQKAIASALEGYGFASRISVDRSSQMDAEQRYWAWLKQEDDGQGTD